MVAKYFNFSFILLILTFCRIGKCIWFDSILLSSLISQSAGGIVLRKNPLEKIKKIYFADAQSTTTTTTERVCCFENMEVTSCYKTCAENTCVNLLNPPKQCTSNCTKNVCVCRDGLYRNGCNECVTQDQCSTSCGRFQPQQCTGKHEMIRGCFDPTKSKVCPEVKFSKPRDIFFKPKPFQPGLCVLSVCDCIDGYLRNKCGECVAPSECGKKCCIGKCSQCTGPNEIRVKHFRKCTARTCKNLKSPLKCEGKAGRVRINVCDCKIGYRRDNCGRCVPEDQCNSTAPCFCTDPCSPVGSEWLCLNECNRRNCRNYYELKTKTCEPDCLYGCFCSATLDQWWNGTACVPGDQCPPYEEAIKIPPVALSEYSQIGQILQLIDNAQTTTMATTVATTTTQATTTQTTPTTIVPISSTPLISITLGLSVGKK